VLLVANHISWLDSYAIHTVADACFVAKTEVGTWPVIGTIAKRFGTLFIERWKRRAAWRTKNAAAALLRARRSVACFPEGTTSEGQMRGFYPALFQAAVDARVAVQPLAIRYYTGEGAPTAAAAYVDDMSFVQSLARLLRERRLIVEIVFGAALEPRDSRQALCRAAEEAVRDGLALPRHWLIELAADRERSGRDRPASRLAPASA
jgi:1-acyl-sn-glycerol-3-phosphate acyltransferase